MEGLRKELQEMRDKEKEEERTADEEGDHDGAVHPANAISRMCRHS